MKELSTITAILLVNYALDDVINHEYAISICNIIIAYVLLRTVFENNEDSKEQKN